MTAEDRARCARPRSIAALCVALAGCTAFEPTVGSKADEEAAMADAGADAPPPVSFRDQIRPLMNRSSTDPSGHGCKACHYSTESSHTGLDQIGLDLATLGALRRGGNTTRSNIVIPGNADDSKLYQKLKGTYPLGARMPRDGPAWSDGDIDRVERWINEGARGDDDE